MSIQIFVEMPKGSKNKYERNEETGEIMLDRAFYGSSQIPFDYGFIKETKGEDGDPLDAVLLVTHPTFPGCVVDAEVVGCLEMEDEGGIDHKIIAVPKAKLDPRWAHVKDINDLTEHQKAEIKEFFDTYKKLEPNKWVKTGEFWTKEKALELVEAAHARLGA